MHGFFTCPECGTRFDVPADAVGAEIACTACPWQGLVTRLEDEPEESLGVGR